MLRKPSRQKFSRTFFVLYLQFTHVSGLRIIFYRFLAIANFETRNPRFEITNAQCNMVLITQHFKDIFRRGKLNSEKMMGKFSSKERPTYPKIYIQN